MLTSAMRRVACRPLVASVRRALHVAAQQPRTATAAARAITANARAAMHQQHHQRRWLSTQNKAGAKPAAPAAPPSTAKPAADDVPVFSEPVPKAMPKRDDPRPVSWMSLAATALIVGGFVLYYEYDKKKRVAKQVKGGTRTVGTPDVGGPFDLIDANGKRVIDSDFIGQYLLVYFGFTHCPDVCPTELKKMERALHALDKAGVAAAQGGITPLFISIDPKRDTPARFREYAKEYHPRTVWLTGSDEQVSRVAKAYRIYWSVPPNASDQYLVDHSIFFFLTDRNGKYLGFYGKNSTAEEVIESISRLIAEDQKKPFVPRPRTEPPPPPPLVKPKFNQPTAQAQTAGATATKP